MNLRDKNFATYELVILVSLFLVLFDNLSFWHHIASLATRTESVDADFVFSVFIFLFGTMIVLVSLFAFNYLFKPLLILILILAAATNYFMNEYGIIIDKAMVRNVFETDVNEVRELISVHFLLYVFILGVIPSLVICKLKIRQESFIRNLSTRTMIVLVSLSVVGLVLFLQYKDFSIVYRDNRHLLCQINPACPLVSLVKHIYRSHKTEEKFHLIATDARQETGSESRKKIVVVLVVGETARARNFSLNHYSRNTNPGLMHANIINFDNVYSCGTSTAESLPCMFSHLSRSEMDDYNPESYENLLDVLARAHINVQWRDNDSGCKGVCKKDKMEFLSVAHVPEICSEKDCYDEILLNGIKEMMRQDNRDLLIVLHQKGSHGPAYFKRYPEAFRTFSPECTNVEVQDCSREEILNSYDNTIVYTDYVLSKLISILDNASGEMNTAMLYLSDHGESLGENGLYLHGLPYLIAPDEQIHVPMILWLSNQYAAYKGVDRNCLSARSREKFSHDNLFDTVLGMFDVKTSLYKKDKDILAICEAA